MGGGICNMWRVDFVRYGQVEIEGKFYEIEVIEGNIGRGDTASEALNSVPEKYVFAIYGRGVEYALLLAFEGVLEDKQ